MSTMTLSKQLLGVGVLEVWRLVRGKEVFMEQLQAERSYASVQSSHFLLIRPGDVPRRLGKLEGDIVSCHRVLGKRGETVLAQSAYPTLATHNVPLSLLPLSLPSTEHGGKSLYPHGLPVRLSKTDYRA